MRVNIDQIRSARTMLRWSQPDLAKRAGVTVDTITRLETGRSDPQRETFEKIIRALELGGIEFIKNGIIRADTIVTLSGQQGFSDFLDDVYLTAIKHGTAEAPTEVFLSNVIHQNWIKWMGSEKWKDHTSRMIDAKDLMDVRIIVQDGDSFFPALDYAQYKWIQPNQFNDRSFYSYHDKLAFLNFKPNDVEITIMNQAEFAEGYRTLFRNTWDGVAYDPPKEVYRHG